MHANNQAMADWTATAGAPWGAAFGYPDSGRSRRADPCPVAGGGPEVEPGGDLLAFLSEFRTAQEEAEGARLAAAQAARAARRAPGSARRRAAQEEAAAGPAAGDGDDSGDPYQGSDVQVAPEWWLATDGRWYRPELHPDARAASESGSPQ